MLQNHAVFVLLLRNAAIIGMRHLAEQIEGTAHIDFFSGLHVQKRQIDHAAAAMTRLLCDAALLKQLAVPTQALPEAAQGSWNRSKHEQKRQLP